MNKHKIITISKIGYNAPSQANWCYGIWKIDFLNLKSPSSYHFSIVVREQFGGESRLIKKVREELKTEMFMTKNVYTNTGTPKITGITKMLDIESKEVFDEIKNFLNKK